MTTAIQSLAKLLAVANIVIDAEVSSRQELFALVDRLLSSQPNLGALMGRKNIWEQNLSTREQLGSTAIGQGVAIPHARMRGLDRAVVAFVRTRKPIDFDAPDGKPVTRVVAIFVPELATQAHLQLLAGVAELFNDSRFREAVDNCESAERVMQLIGERAART